MVVKGSKRNEKEEQQKMLVRWVIYSSIYALIMGILYGTANYYFETIPLLFGLYMDISWTIIILGLSGWALMSWVVFKKYNIKILRI